MKAEDYVVVEKEGIQIGAGVSASGSPVLFVASPKGKDAEVSSSDDYLVASTEDSFSVLSALAEGKSEKEILSSSSTLSFAYISRRDKSYVICRRKEGKSEVWRYSSFPGFGHILSEKEDVDPIVMDFTSTFSSFVPKLWAKLDGYDRLEINLEEGESLAVEDSKERKDQRSI